MKKDETYSGYSPGSQDLVNKIVEDHLGWTKSIAKAVARSWNLDWQLDGLDGGAFEALLFCAQRYDPSLGVPFRAYARRRIHEASTEEARKSKSWARGVGTNSQAEQDAREISASLFQIFPEMRDGILPGGFDDSDEGMRGSIRQLLAGACLLTAFQESSIDNPEVAVEYKRLVTIMSSLEPVHQAILWAVYWEGQSMRSLAEEWEIDDLSVIREHKEILAYLHAEVSGEDKRGVEKPKVRRGLRAVALKLKRKKENGPFSRLRGLTAAVALLVFFLAAQQSAALLAMETLDGFKPQPRFSRGVELWSEK